MLQSGLLCCQCFLECVTPTLITHHITSFMCKISVTFPLYFRYILQVICGTSHSSEQWHFYLMYAWVRILHLVFQMFKNLVCTVKNYWWTTPLPMIALKLFFNFQYFFSSNLSKFSIQTHPKHLLWLPDPSSATTDANNDSSS